MFELFASLAPTIIGGFLGSKASSAAAAGQQAGAANQAAMDAQSRGFAREVFNKQIERQKPFVEAGKLALPQYVSSMGNYGDVSGLPVTRMKGSMLSGFLGENAPSYVTDDALKDINALEQQRNLGRLSDLINVGLGGVTGTSSTGMNMTNAITDSSMNQANIEANALNQAAINRQNRDATLIQGLSGIPALISASRQNTFNPYQSLPNLRRTVGGGGFI